MMTYAKKIFTQDELNDIAYREFIKEVKYVVSTFEHVVDAKTNMMQFNEANIILVTDAIAELKETAKNFTPNFGGQDMGLEYDFSDCVWDEIWNCWSK
jgi:hypothetical protein